MPVGEGLLTVKYDMHQVRGRKRDDNGLATVFESMGIKPFEAIDTCRRSSR